MDTIPSYGRLEGVHCAADTRDRACGGDDRDDASRAFALLRIPQEMREEIFSTCCARDITRLACVSVSMWVSLRQHPVTLAFVQMGLSCRYTALIDSMEAIQSAALPFRASLMREYACRMVHIDDGDGAVPWRKYYRLCMGQLTSGGNASVARSGCRDLRVAKSIALLRILKRPLQQPLFTDALERKIEVLPSHYLSDVFDALLGLDTGATRSFSWRSVLRMRWQVQPLLLARLICRAGFSRADVEPWWGLGGYLERWEQKVVTASIAYDRPRLAIRTLTIAYHLSSLDGPEERAAILLHALTVAREKTPPWSWNELIALLCLHAVQSDAIPGAHWPTDIDVVQWMTDFLSDRATSMIAPSPMFVATLIRHAVAIWRRLPDDGDADGSCYERLCDRLDLQERDRGNLRETLTRGFASEAADIGDVENLLPVARRADSPNNTRDDAQRRAFYDTVDNDVR